MMAMDLPAVLWLRQDLRLSDNPALHAVADRPVLPVFVLDDAAAGGAHIILWHLLPDRGVDNAGVDTVAADAVAGARAFHGDGFGEEANGALGG
jgi:hypothetical protein